VCELLDFIVVYVVIFIFVVVVVVIVVVVAAAVLVVVIFLLLDSFVDAFNFRLTQTFDCLNYCYVYIGKEYFGAC
jgi:hypothetical protein